MEEENPDSELIFENVNMEPEPQSTPILVEQDAMSINNRGLDFTAGLSILKYGAVTILAMIPAILLIFIAMGIAYVIGEASGQPIILGLLLIIAGFVAVVGSIQIMVYPVSMALADGKADGLRMNYMATWKASAEMIIETIAVFGSILVLLLLGGVLAESVPVLGGLLLVIGFFGIILFQIGLVPYVVKKIAAQM
jgi:hypothetical protein